MNLNDRLDRRMHLWLTCALLWTGLGSAQTFTNTVGGPIPDAPAAGPRNYGTALDVPIVVSGVTQGTIDTVSVAFNANHGFVGDLQVTLISPYGQEHLLFETTGASDGGGGSPANLVAANTYTFSDATANNWWTVAGLGDTNIPTATARTVVSGGPGVVNPAPTTSMLDVFQRRPPNGTWILRFRDGWIGDAGQVTAASITLTTTGVTRTVTKVEDTNDGLCDADCSLREAIAASSNGEDSVDRIEFARPFFDSPRRIVLTSNIQFETNPRAFALMGPGAPLLNLSGVGLYDLRVQAQTFSPRTISFIGIRITDLTGVLIDAPSALLHGMEFAFLSGRILLTRVADINDSSIHSNRTDLSTLITFGNSTLRRVTVSGNTADNPALSLLGNTSLFDCTIVGNRTSVPGSTGGVLGNAQVRIQNSVIADNTGGMPTAQDLSGNFQSLGHNLIGAVGSSTAFNQSGDQTGTGANPLNPVLSPLSRHGGPIPVHVPLPGSPLIDQGHRLRPDARGVALVDLADVAPASGGNNGDIGAVELSPLLVSNLNDSGPGSLRQILQDAPAAPAISDILFSLNLPPAAKIVLTSGQLSIDKNVSIHGPGARALTISGNRQSRVLAVQSNRRVSVSGLTLADGNGAGTPNDLSGGIVFSANGSQLAIVDSVLRNGQATLGVGGWLLDSNAFGELLGSTASDMLTNAIVAVNPDAAILLHRATISGCAVNCFSADINSESSLLDSTLVGTDGQALQSFGRLLMRNTLLAGSSIFDGPPADLISAGHNLISATASTAFTGPGDQVGTLAAPLDPRLSPLAHHGGPVPTHVPLVGSPALDQGLRFSTDARGQRLFDIPAIPLASGGNHSDVGAVEVQAQFVSNTSDSGAGSLRQAVLDANANGVALDDVLFDLPNPSTIILQSRLPNPVSGGALNLLGNGADRTILSGNSQVQLFSFTAPGHLGMSRLGLIDFRAVDGPALEAYQTEVHLTELEVSGNAASRDGGAMLIGDADVVIQSSTFAGNAGTGNYGALAYLGSNTSAQIRNSTFSGNAGPGGSAVANVARGAAASVLELHSATLAGNTGSAALSNTALSSGAAHSSAQNTLFSGAVSSISNSGAPASFTSQGFNLSSTPEPLLTQGSDRVNVNPDLGPLQFNGAATRTRALLLGSAAIDAGIGHSIVDQRGEARPTDEPAVTGAADSSDIGAFETQPVTLEGTTGGDVFEVTGDATTTTVRLNGNQIFSAPTANQLSLTLNGQDGADTFNVLSIAIPLQLNGGTSADNFNIGTSNTPGNPGLLTPINAVVRVNGGPGPDLMTIDGSGAAVVADYTISSTQVTRSSPAGFGGVAYNSLSTLLLATGAGANQIAIQSTAAGVSTSVTSGAGNDTIQLAEGVSLNGGTVDGGADNDTLSYAAFSTGVAVNLGLSTSALNATLDATQRVPVSASPSTSSATATLIFDVSSKTFSLNASVTGLQAAEVSGIRLSRAPVGGSGALVVPLTSLGTRTPTPEGFNYSVANVPLPALQEAALLGGLLYLDFSVAFESGRIRGQLLSSSNVAVGSGSASGTGGVSNIENVQGGAGADSLVGNAAANTLAGNDGDDTLLGGPGSDSLSGDGGLDTTAWNNGDGSDVTDGGSAADVLQVNGSLTAADTFVLNANAARATLSRTSPGPFSLDIGSTESLVIAAAGGDDVLTVNSLVGVADVDTIQLSGLAGNDTFNLTPVPNGSARAIRVNGGTQSLADAVTLNLTGVSNPAIALDGNGSGSFTSSTHQSISLISIESVPSFGDAVFRNGFE